MSFSRLHRPISKRPSSPTACPPGDGSFPHRPAPGMPPFRSGCLAWFEAHSLTNPSARQDLQQPGLRASVRRVGTIVEQESQRLHTESGLPNAHARLVLGGISLGGAVALWTLLGTDQPERPLFGLVAVSTWLPFVGEIIKRYLILDIHTWIQKQKQKQLPSRIVRPKPRRRQITTGISYLLPLSKT